MPSPAQEFAALQKLTPAEAVAYLQRRNKVTETYSWRDLWQEGHAQQFTVSRLARADLLKSIQDQITKSVGGDLSRRDFMRDSKKMLQDAGWWGEKEVTDPSTGEILTTTFDPPRLSLIFDVNTSMAYASGQWSRVQRAKRTHPYLRYISMDDDRVRPEHRAWHNLTLPVDHPFWLTHFIPNGWRCRCRIVAVTQREYDSGLTPTGERMKKTAPVVVMRDWLDKSTGQVRQIPVGIDLGFGYNVGVAAQRSAQLQSMMTDKIGSLPAPIASATASDLAGSPEFKRWLANPQGSWPLVRISDADAKAIGSKLTVAQLSADTAIKQVRVHPELTADEYSQAQFVADHATTTVQDSATSLVYVLEQGSSDAGGYVLVVKATRTGEGLFITSYRRLSRLEAIRDAEIGRLIGKGQKK
jgi:SPP1 gp7 family putative phage head morphogenesis protein